MNSLEQQVGGDHYKKHGALQPWCILREYLTAEELRGYHKGTAINYLLRERDKGGDEDIRKALHTLQHLVETTVATQGVSPLSNLSKLKCPLCGSKDLVWVNDVTKCTGCGVLFNPNLVAACDERKIHNPAGLTDPGKGYRFAYVDEPRNVCSHFWTKSEGWVLVTGTGDQLAPDYTYRVKL